jgi:hypothetical protein
MIKLFGQWYIDATDQCYQLKERQAKPDKDGNDVFSTEGYYPNISGALKGLRRRILRDEVASGTITTIDGYIKELRYQDDLFETMLKVLEE